MSGVTEHLARFAGAMRAHGIRVGLSDEIGAAAAPPLVDALDRAEVRRGLRIAFKVPREAWTTFDRLFDEHGGGVVAPEVPVPPAAHPRERGRSLQWRWDGGRVRLEASEPEHTGADEPGYTSERLLRRKAFDRISVSELAAMHHLPARLDC